MNRSDRDFGVLDVFKGKLKFLLDRWRTSIAVFVLYTVLTLIFTYPVAFSENMVPGEGDVFQFLWFFWSVKTSLLSLTTPYYSPMIFYPSGVSLAFSGITILNSAASIPLQIAFGLVNAYNIIWISSFILSGCGMFLLVKYLTDDTKAAFVSGLIFMFCPYRFAHALGHMNLISTQWIPLYILYLNKTVDEKKLSNALLASLFLLLNALSCYYYLIYMFTFTLIYLLYNELNNKNIFKIDVVKRVGIMAISFIFVVSPFLYPLFKEMFASKSEYMYYGGFVEYSADLLAFFVPSVLHPVFKDIVSPLYANFTGNYAESIVFAGYTVIIISAYTFLKLKTKEVKFWSLSAAIFFVLSLGPILHLRGLFSFAIENYTVYIPLPYAILMQIPLFSLARVPSRWDVLVMLSLAVLCGYGLSSIFKSRKSDQFNKKNPIFVLVTVLILVEFLSVPYPIIDAEVPVFYKEIANDQENYAIIEVPNIISTMTLPEYMYYQTVHGKKLVNGYTSRTPNYVTQFIHSTALINQLMEITLWDTEVKPSFYDIIDQNLTNIGPSILNYYDIKYIVVHENLLTGQQIELIKTLLQNSTTGSPTLYKEDSMVVFEVKKTPLIQFTSLTGSGWHGLDDWNGTPTRWMENDATIMIYSPEDQNVDLSFKANSLHRPRTLEIYLNEHPQKRIKIRSNVFEKVYVTEIRLKEGSNIVRFHVPDGCESPSDIAELNNLDTRCLSIAIQDIKIISNTPR